MKKQKNEQTEAKAKLETKPEAEAKNLEKQPESGLKSKLTKKNIVIGAVSFLVILLITLIPVTYFAAIKYNLFGLNEGTINIDIKIEGEGQEKYYDTITLLVDEKEVSLNEDLTYTQKIIAGKTDLEVSGDYYTNKKSQVEIKKGETTNYTFTLKPTASLVIKATDFLSGEEIKGFNVDIGERKLESNGSTEITVEDLILEDLDIKSFTISKDGYVTKTFEIDKQLEQGLNEFYENELVKEGKFYYVSNSGGSESIFSANYDGTDRKKLTDDKGSDTSPTYNIKDNRLYFLSNRAGEKDEYGNVMYYLYSSLPDGSGLKRETTGNYKDNRHIGEYSVYSKLRTYTKYDQGDGRYYLYYGSIKGDAITRINTEFSDYYRGHKVSNNGKFVLYSQQHNSGKDNEVERVYLYDIASKKNTIIFEVYKSESITLLDVSLDSKYALVQVNDQKGEGNLWRIGIGDKKKLTDDKNYEHSGEFLADNEHISYSVVIDGKNSVFTRGIDGSDEKKWTGNHKVENYVWVNSNTLLFSTNEGVFITSNAAEAKKVLDGASSGTFTSFIGYDD